MYFEHASHLLVPHPSRQYHLDSEYNPFCLFLTGFHDAALAADVDVTDSPEQSGFYETEHQSSILLKHWISMDVKQKSRSGLIRFCSEYMGFCIYLCTKKRQTHTNSGFALRLSLIGCVDKIDTRRQSGPTR